ncbi:hypothetical protein O181_009238 [Austropuccinia psidii MF-1]|uniref:Uncharacterized protein n=1 Tax=Austropuccinia psidii MF-1 TaxID=1389203 RepID=A0A9Q3GJ97_9BASI|nr:hypothetical protein [Austropuccinia psidii MF-1]
MSAVIKMIGTPGSLSTEQSPFFTVYGRDPQCDPVHITQDNPSGKLSTKIQSVQRDVKRELEVSINRLKRYSDKSRASPPDFNPGEMSCGKSALMPAISMEVHPSSLPYFTLRTSQDLKNHKLESRASSPNHNLRRRGMGSFSKSGLKAQERKPMVSGGMERFQSIPKKIHLGTSQKPQELSRTCQGFSFFIP